MPSLTSATLSLTSRRKLWIVYDCPWKRPIGGSGASEIMPPDHRDAQRERMAGVDRHRLAGGEVDAHEQPGHELLAAELLEQHVARGAGLLGQRQAPATRVAQAREPRGSRAAWRGGHGPCRR